MKAGKAGKYDAASTLFSLVVSNISVFENTVVVNSVALLASGLFTKPAESGFWDL